MSETSFLKSSVISSSSVYAKSRGKRKQKEGEEEKESGKNNNFSSPFFSNLVFLELDLLHSDGLSLEDDLVHKGKRALCDWLTKNTRDIYIHDSSSVRHQYVITDIFLLPLSRLSLPFPPSLYLSSREVFLSDES